MTSTEYGVWDDECGGFIATQCWSRDEAAREIDRLVDQEDAERSDLSVAVICADHPEHHADSCEECFADHEEEEEEYEFDDV